MGDGTKENPYTSKDVLRLIEKNGGKAEGLDLSGKTFADGIDLSGLELEGIIFKKARFPIPMHFEGQELVGVKFNGSNLSRADFREVNLQYAQFGMLDKKPTCLESADLRGTILLNANFQGAELSCAIFGKADDQNYGPATLEDTDFRNASLFKTNFIGCYFYGTKFEGAFIRGVEITDAHLEYANWGNYKVGEEAAEGNKKDLSSAKHYYRHFKVWYKQSGYDDTAAKFYYREKEANRKSLRLFSKSWNHRIASQLSYWVFGHGEGWKRILLWIAGFVLGFALLYYKIGTLTPNTFLDSLYKNSSENTPQLAVGMNRRVGWSRSFPFLQYPPACWGDVYYSAASFVALGYGAWVEESIGWVKGLGVTETFLGFFMMTLLLVTFVRKWAR